MKVGKWWLENPWRLVQTNLREIDFRDMDPGQFVQDLLDQHATVAMVSTSGIVANYPTRLPYQFRNPYASDTILKELIDECHLKGIRVIGRMDFSKVREPMSSQHPEWAFIGEKGGPVCYNGDTHVCCNSEYQRFLSLNILRETLEELPLDGVFFNFGGYTSGYDYSGNLYGDCVCPNCRKRFEEMYHQPLPEHPSRSPFYEEFKRRTMDQAAREVRELIQRVRPGICVANDFFSAEGFCRMEAGSHGGKDWVFLASDLAMRSRVGYPRMRASITSVDFIEIAYRYASPSPARQALRLAQSLAHGGSPDLYIMGRLDNREDQSGRRATEKMFAWHEKHQELYDHLTPLGNVLLVRPQISFMSSRGAGKEYAGWFDMLTQAHFSFCAVEEARLSEMSLNQYSAVLLPCMTLSEKSEKALAAYLKKGGRLLATMGGDSLPAWLGVEKILGETRDTRGSYVHLTKGDLSPHVLKEGVQVLPIIGGYVHGAYAAETEKCQRVIAPHPYGPPERCYYTEISEEPGYTVSRANGGCAVFVPWLPGTSFGYGKQTALALWMQDILEEKMDVHPLKTNAPACVEIAWCRRDEKRDVLHLVNASGSIGEVWRDPLPLGRIQVTLPMEKPLRVTALDGTACRWDWRDGQLTLETELNQVLTAIHIERC